MKVKITLKFKGAAIPILPRGHGIFDVEEIEDFVTKTFQEHGSRVKIKIAQYEQNSKDGARGESAQIL